jgi:hypothetical protein
MDQASPLRLEIGRDETPLATPLFASIKIQVLASVQNLFHKLRNFQIHVSNSVQGMGRMN